MAECVSKIIFTPEDLSGTRNPLHLSLPSTPFLHKSVLTNFSSAHTQLSLVYSLSGWSSDSATARPSVPLPLSSHLSAVSCVFPHGFVNAALSHSPTWCMPRWSDRCCSSSVCLAFPPVTPLFMSPNHSAATTLAKIPAAHMNTHTFYAKNIDDNCSRLKLGPLNSLLLLVLYNIVNVLVMVAVVQVIRSSPKY